MSHPKNNLTYTRCKKVKTEFYSFVAIKKKLNKIFLLIISDIFLLLHWHPTLVSETDWTWFWRTHVWLYRVWLTIMHIGVKTKLMGQKNWLQRSKTGLFWSSNLERAAREVIGQNSTFLQDVLKNMSNRTQGDFRTTPSCTWPKQLSHHKSSPELTLTFIIYSSTTLQSVLQKTKTIFCHVFLPVGPWKPHPHPLPQQKYVLLTHLLRTCSHRSICCWGRDCETYTHVVSGHSKNLEGTKETSHKSNTLSLVHIKTQLQWIIHL